LLRELRFRSAGHVCNVGGVTAHEIPATGSAELHVLHDGYVGLDGDDGRVSGTVTLIVDSPAVIVVDPGMVASRSGLLAALGSYGFEPSGVTDVVFSHHHPDHTVNAALFPAARIHDHWAVYEGDRWTDRDADGVLLSPSVRLLRTPGHTAEDISTVAATADGVYVCTHAWWSEDGERPARHGARGPEQEPGAPAVIRDRDHPGARRAVRRGCAAVRRTVAVRCNDPAGGGVSAYEALSSREVPAWPRGPGLALSPGPRPNVGADRV
jgi:hypothetical protein